jgi:hypothetical protein
MRSFVCVGRSGRINEGATPMMKRTTSLTLATLVVVVAAAGAVPALAQQGPGGPGQRHEEMRGPGARDGVMHEERGMMRGGGMLALVCSDNGADRLEHMLLSVAQRTDLTAEQQPLYDTLKSTALAAQADFAAACTAARPADGTDVSSVDLADRLKARLEIDKARVAAMEGVVPAFEAFYDSLTDAQKQALAPERRAARRMLDGPKGEHRHQHGTPDQQG